MMYCLTALCMMLMFLIVYLLLQLRIKNNIRQVSEYLEQYSQDLSNIRVRLMTTDLESRWLVAEIN